jgi:hypothetical protein
MSYYLTDEIVKSLTEYAAKVEQAYRERPLCHFDWKPACISVNELNPSKVFFNMVWLDDESLKGCVSVDDLVITDNNLETQHKLDFSIWKYNRHIGNSTAKFVIPYHGGIDWDSIGQYIYDFVDEVDTLLCYY